MEPREAAGTGDSIPNSHRLGSPADLASHLAQMRNPIGVCLERAHGRSDQPQVPHADSQTSAYCKLPLNRQPNPFTFERETTLPGDDATGIVKHSSRSTSFN